jgi:hypothetical protein
MLYFPPARGSERNERTTPDAYVLADFDLGTRVT